ncbi:hypothetical protein P153DRAFT_287670 [Dothidotthia symphoricarpi CBS 119687]|uniref:Uncharacterized protein n=1 Tax=Dothidotthia symphoricarpi CBS 119687 TaxID=1392245 RepID=A0A6A6AFV7_9PLEO|nr:uncharacterized protein P153DRAFT_287670 [Dothidotthia symphoricarpi CBS 119687]KAF2130862.1 hypothetical protein P153DRAFT_287670 [Dothidotthia symphoricarpi CBS 119687]
MYTHKSTQSLLDLFPMFGHPGISALEYAGVVEETRKKNTSLSASLKCKTSSSALDENTVPSTAAETDPVKAEQVQFIAEFGCQQRRRGKFVNHTPRNFEMRTTQRVDIYGSARPESENYSRPRASIQVNSDDTRHPSTNQHGYGSLSGSRTAEKRITLNRGAPVELDSKEIILETAPRVYRPSIEVHRRSVSTPKARVAVYPSRTAASLRCLRGEVNVRSSSATHHRQPEETQQSQTPYKNPIHGSRNGARHAPLEPLVALHMRKEADSVLESLSSQEVETKEDMATFQVIQKYFESEGKTSSPRSNIKYHPQPSSPSRIPLTTSPESPTPGAKLNIHVPPMNELEMSYKFPPAVPDRSPKRLESPSFPLRTMSAATRNRDPTVASEDPYSPHTKKSNPLHVPKHRTSRYGSVGQAARAGSSNLGRMAPLILGHAALTASSDLGLNDISSYLRNTGPPTDTQTTTRQRIKAGMKMFRVNDKKSLAARVGSVEGSPQRPRIPVMVPACAREMTTSAGARHLKIVIPIDAVTSNQTFPLPVNKAEALRRSKHRSLSFNEEMLCPSVGSENEHVFAAEPHERSSSAPISRRSPPITPKREHVQDHPLASREEQTRARKLRDLQKVRRNFSSSDIQNVAPPTPTLAQDPESLGADDESSREKMAKLEEKVGALQKLNTQLAETLTSLLGDVESKDGKIKNEDVLRACRLAGYEGVLMGIDGTEEKPLELDSKEEDMFGGKEWLRLDFEGDKERGLRDSTWSLTL